MSISMNISPFKTFTQKLSFGEDKQQKGKAKGTIAPLIGGTMLALNIGGCQEWDKQIDLSNENFLGMVAEDKNALFNPKAVFSQEEISNLKHDPLSLKKLQEDGRVKKSVEMHDVTNDGIPDAIYEDSSSIYGTKHTFVQNLKEGEHYALINCGLYKFIRCTH